MTWGCMTDLHIYNITDNYSDKEVSNNSPSRSTISGGKTREANARRKIVENSLSKPPIPILVKSQSGEITDWYL